ncbi:MAG: trimeric intracellular cation channel family protein [Actinobacteria bacterium]|nr:MAG: trimeric intracellular cation channel family protein [Actinomycetota bacterium]
MLEGQFYLPISYDLIATFLFAVTGALVAYRKGYDYLGLFSLALATGAGGGLIRDGIFLQTGPPAFVTDWRYMAMVLAAGFLVILAGENIKRVNLVILLADALGLGFYAAVGAQKSINLGLSVLAAGLIGLINAVGGGMLRDVLSREEPIIFQPGQLYAMAALFGVTTFLALGVGFRINAQAAALISIGVAFVTRTVSIIFDIHTHPVKEHRGRAAVKRSTRKMRRISRKKGADL